MAALGGDEVGFDGGVGVELGFDVVVYACDLLDTCLLDLKTLGTQTMSQWRGIC